MPVVQAIQGSYSKHKTLAPTVDESVVPVTSRPAAMFT